MKKLYTDMDIRFQVENTEFLVLNIVFENFDHGIPRHSHGRGSYELHYISNGYGMLIADQKKYQLVPNTLYVTGPYVEHEQYPDKECPMEEYCFYFKIPKEGERGSMVEAFEAMTFWIGQDTQDIYSLIKLIFQELENLYTGYMIQVESMLKQCLVKMVRNYQSGYRKQSDKRFDTSNLTERKYVIAEEYFLYEYQNLSLNVLAELLGLGVRQTNRFLKECYGKNFQQKKLEARMSAASVLLMDHTRTATDVALALNYSSLEHFSMAFKNYYGMTIREYRKQE